MVIRYLWLASFPRSGNTFIRNIFHHVYGLNSLEDESELDLRNRGKFTLIKTHDLPYNVKNYSPKKDKVIYIVRDGRDAISSLAYKRKNLIEPDSDLQLNFKEATYAEKSSFFGGWDNNCRLWLGEHPILIRFEDLIADPKKAFAEIERHIDLPPANWNELPTFEKQKSGATKFGSEGGSHQDIQNFSQIFFRKGGSGNWKTEMTKDLQQYFWERSVDVMKAFGYTENGEVNELNQTQIDAIANAKQFNLILKYKLKLGDLHVRYRAMKQSIKRIFNK